MSGLCERLRHVIPFSVYCTACRAYGAVKMSACKLGTAVTLFQCCCMYEPIIF